MDVLNSVSEDVDLSDNGETNVVSLVPPDNYLPEEVVEMPDMTSTSMNLIPDEDGYYNRTRIPTDNNANPRKVGDLLRLLGAARFASGSLDSPDGVTDTARVTLRLPAARPVSSADNDTGRQAGASSSLPSPSPSRLTDQSEPRQIVNSSLNLESSDLLSRLKAVSVGPSPAKSPAVIRVASDNHVSSTISPVGPNSATSELRKIIQSPVSNEVQINTIEQEGRILAKVSDLRKMGKWEDSRLPRCVTAEPFSRGVKNFTKEVTWVATLIAKEKKAKMAMAKKIAYAAKKWHERRAEKIRRIEREEEQRLRKTAKTIGGLVHQWWLELGKVAKLKQKEEIEIRKKDIRDLHLQHLMDQTEEFSSRMAQGLARSSSQASLTPSEPVDHVTEDPADREYEHDEDDSLEDDEDTISDEEASESAAEAQQNDAKLLADEADIPLEDLLPPEYRERFLNLAAPSDGPTKRKRTSSRSLSTDLYELEPKTKKIKEDDLSQLVEFDFASTSQTMPENRQLDAKLRSDQEKREKLLPKGNSLSSTEVVTKVPVLLRGDLREYQHVGLDWLVSLYNNKMNGILADEMGLGKTIQTIAFIAHLASEQGDWGPHLVIVPTSVLLNWELEFKRWCPGLIIKTYYGSRKQRENLRTGWTKPDSFHICITSYKVATQDYTSFRRMKWHYLILDEAQAIKNYKSQRWLRIAEFPSQRRLLLTGTPMQNSLEEVWALLHFLQPELFESLDMFQQLFSNLTAMSEGRKPQDHAIVKQLHTALRPFILRRMKSEVEQQLPKKYEQVLKCRLSKRQRYLYDDYMSRTKTKETLKAGNYLSVINILMQLRKVCNHPNLFEERPVLSPLVIPPLTVKLPALVFDIKFKDTENAPYFREVSTCLTRPFSEPPKNLMSFETARLVELIPADTELLTAADATKELVLPRPLPSDFSLLFAELAFTITDLMAGTPFIVDDERLCNGDCRHPPPPPIRAYTTIATVHMGRAKRSATKKKTDRKGRLNSDGTLTNGVKKPRLSYLETESSRITTKHFAEEVLPARFRQQREDHCEVLVFSNRVKCTMRPLISSDLLNLMTMGKDGNLRVSFATGMLQCQQAQEECRRVLPYQERPSGLVGLTELGSHVTKFMDRPDDWYWIEHGSVAFMPVWTPPPVLIVSNMASRVERDLNGWKRVVEPVLKEVSTILHPVERLRVMKFPETRLIQYDCGKLQKLNELLRERFAGGHRCLIFTQMTRVLDILEIFLTYHGYKYLRLDGSTGIELRQTLMDRFNRDPRYFCFILSTRSGGVGVNLTGADTVVFYDSDWNPTMDAQAQDRCHRIGQTRDVNIYRLISEYTVEENIFEKATQKRYLGHLAIESGTFTTAVLKRENFKDIFGLKDDEVAAEVVEETTTDANIESALAKVEDADDVAAAKKAKTEAAVEAEEDDEDDDVPKFKALVKFLSKIQCFGLKYLEEHIINQDVMDELEQTREEVERRKREWELNRLEIAKAEKLKAEEDAHDPFLVSRSLLDPKDCQDEDMPIFDFRDAFPPSDDKENSSDLYITDFSYWGTLYRNPPPEMAMPMSKNKSRMAGKNKKGKLIPDSLMGAKSSRRKKDQLMPLSFDSTNSGGLRGPSHLGMARELSSVDLPDSVMGSDAVAPDWRPFEDWQIVMTAAMLQGIPQNPQLALPSVTATSCELTSYVTSTVNPKYRQSRECQARLRAIRLREEKDPSSDTAPPPKKKKKTKIEENFVADKTLFPVPKKAIQALQDDNGRSRTQIYRDMFGAFRGQTYNPPNQRRDASSLQRAGTGAWSSSVFQESGIALDEPVTPLAMLKRRQERSNLSKNFLTEHAYRWAQTMNMTVDPQGQPADANQIRSPQQQKASTILQATLAAAAPRTPTAANMPLLSAVVAGNSPQTPLPSPQYMAMGTAANVNAVRRQVQFPSANSPAPVPPSSSPLPSIGATSLTQLIATNQPLSVKTMPMPVSNLGSSVAAASLQSSLSPSESSSPLVASHNQPTTPTTPVIQKTPEQLSQERAKQLAFLRTIFTLPPGQTSFTPQDMTRIREYLSNRGIVFSDAQLADLVRAFANKSGNPAPGVQGAIIPVSDGTGGVRAPVYHAVQPSSVALVNAGQMPQRPSILTPVTAATRQLNYRGMVRLPGNAQTGSATIINFVPQPSNIVQPQTPQTVRPQIMTATKRAVNSPAQFIPTKNGSISVPTAQVKPLAPGAVSQNIAIQPNPNRGPLPSVTMTLGQIKQIVDTHPTLKNTVRMTSEGITQIQRDLLPTTITLGPSPQVAQQNQSQSRPTVYVFPTTLDGKALSEVLGKREQNSNPPTPNASSVPEPS